VSALSRLFSWQYDAAAQSTGHALPVNGSGGEWFTGALLRAPHTLLLTPPAPRAMREPGTNVGAVTANAAY
jgi:hypothetical protein